MRRRANGRSVRGGAVALTLIVATQTGCAATGMHLRYGELKTRTEMQEPVFMDPANESPATFYVQETSSVDGAVSVVEGVRHDVAASGYTEVDDPSDATYIVQIHHRQVLEQELDDGMTLSDAIGNAYAAGAGAAIATGVFIDSDVAGEAGVIVGALAFVLDARTKHVAHTLTTDVQITERCTGDGGAEIRTHRTQVVAGASKVNLERDEAMPALIRGTAHVVANLLPPVRRSASAGAS